MVPRTSQRRALRTQLPPQANDHCWSPTLLPSPHAKGPLAFPQQEVPSLGLQEGNLGGDPGPCACPTASPDPSAPHTRRPHGREVPCLRGTAPPSSNAPRVCSALPPFSLTPTPRPWARPAPGWGAHPTCLSFPGSWLRAHCARPALRTCSSSFAHLPALLAKGSSSKSD